MSTPDQFKPQIEESTDYEVGAEEWSYILRLSDDIVAQKGEIRPGISLTRVDASWGSDFGADSVHCKLSRRVTTGRDGFVYILRTFSTMRSGADTQIRFSTLEPGYIEYDGPVEQTIEKDAQSLGRQLTTESIGQMAEMELTNLLATAPIKFED